MGTRTTTVNYDPNGNKTYTTTYHRRRTERVIFNLIFDAFVAPIIALARTFFAICFHLTVFFVIPVLVSVGIDAMGAHLKKMGQMEFVAGFIATSSAILFAYSGFIFQYANFGLAAVTSLLSAISTLITAYTMPTFIENPYTLGASAGIGACAGAILHWLCLEPRQETLSQILCHHYGQIATTVQAKETKVQHSCEQSSGSSTTMIEEISSTMEVETCVG